MTEAVGTPPIPTSRELRAARNAQPRLISVDELRETLGEGIHVAFRKAADSPAASKIWDQIKDLDKREWAGVLDFVAMGVLYNAPAGVPAPAEGTVSISRSEYDELRRSSQVLENLQAAGVDNWEGYDIAMSG